MAEAIRMPADGLILNWLKAVGDTVKKGDVILEVEADKATVELEAPADGVLLEQLGAPGDELEENALIGYVGAAGEVPEKEAVAIAEPAPVAEQTATALATPTPVSPPTTNGAGTVPTDGRIKASPVARKVAAEKGIDLSQVSGSGPHGRIVKADIEGFTPAATPTTTVTSATTGTAAATTYGALPEGDDVEIIDVSRMRERIAAGTVLSTQQIPHFYVTSDIDVAAMLNLRKELNASLGQDGTKITVNDMIVKATALTLREFPNLNTHYYGDKFVRHQQINIGIAVALPGGGLINVVSHNADTVALGTLAAHNKAAITRARDGKIKPADIKGSTFTVSNLGAYDVEHFIAIISPPEAGILAVGSAKKVPIVRQDGTLGVGSRMKVTISVDHRVSDGAEGAEFMQAFKRLVENPIRLLV